MTRPKKSPAPQEPQVSLPLIANGRRVTSLVAALALVAAAAFFAGSLVRAPQQSALDAAEDHLEVSRPVEERVVATGVELPGQVVPGPVVALQLPSPGGEGGASRSIVTRSTLVPGQAVAPGTLLGEVSGTPIVALPPGVPLYRDLVDGSTGADVSALQSALEQLGFAVSVTGEVGPRTLAAVAAFYEQAGAENSDDATIRWAELLPVAANATVTTAAPVGTVLTDEIPFASVKVGADVIVVRATVLEADELVVGQTVELRTSGGSAPSTVAAVGEFTATEEGSGRDITIGIPSGFEVVASAPVLVAAGKEGDAGPAVPTVALRQDAQGTYVELARPADAGAGQRQRVYVVVGAQSGGWSAIEPDDRLPVGTPVVVSP